MYSSKNPQGGQKAITHYQVLKENNLAKSNDSKTENKVLAKTN